MPAITEAMTVDEVQAVWDEHIRANSFPKLADPFRAKAHRISGTGFLRLASSGALYANPFRSAMDAPATTPPVARAPIMDTEEDMNKHKPATTDLKRLSEASGTRGFQDHTAEGKVNAGIRQGCPLSPSLSVIVLTVIFVGIDQDMDSKGTLRNTLAISQPYV